MSTRTVLFLQFQRGNCLSCYFQIPGTLLGSESFVLCVASVYSFKSCRDESPVKHELDWILEMILLMFLSLSLSFYMQNVIVKWQNIEYP